jgi:hypothetical protein
LPRIVSRDFKGLQSSEIALFDFCNRIVASQRLQG